MRKITVECTNQGYCSNYGIKHELDAYKGYLPKQYDCTECGSTMSIEKTEDKEDQKQAESSPEEGPETAR